MITKDQIDQFISDHKAEMLDMVKRCYELDPMAEIGRGIDAELNILPVEWGEKLIDWNGTEGRWNVQPLGTTVDAYVKAYRWQLRNYVHVHPATLPGPSPRDRWMLLTLTQGDFFLTLNGTGVGVYCYTSILTDREALAWDESMVMLQ